MRTLGITLAKGRSRGIPNKNMREIAGKPLLEWTLVELKKANKLDFYIVSSDAEYIRNFSVDHGASAHARLDYLARDNTPSIDVINNIMSYVQVSLTGFDAIALIPCTTPLRTAADIDNAIQMLEDNPGADSVIGVTECEYVERVKHVRDGLITDIVPEPQDGQRQNLEKCYTRSGIYVVRRDSLDKLFGHKNSLAYILPPERGINIDTMLDFKIAEMLLEERGGL